MAATIAYPLLQDMHPVFRRTCMCLDKADFTMSLGLATSTAFSPLPPPHPEIQYIVKGRPQHAPSTLRSGVCGCVRFSPSVGDCTFDDYCALHTVDNRFNCG